jgi:hypothetical protein
MYTPLIDCGKTPNVAITIYDAWTPTRHRHVSYECRHRDTPNHSGDRSS